MGSREALLMYLGGSTTGFSGAGGSVGKWESIVVQLSKEILERRNVGAAETRGTRTNDTEDG